MLRDVSVNNRLTTPKSTATSTGSTTTPTMDDYKVSFNSDTSDSEEEESRASVKPPPAADVVNCKGENGHTAPPDCTVEGSSQPGIIKQAKEANLESNDIIANGVVANGYAESKTCIEVNGSVDVVPAEMNGMPEITESNGGRTVISAKDDMLPTDNATSQAEANNDRNETSEAELSKITSASAIPEKTANPECLLVEPGESNPAGEDTKTNQVCPDHTSSPDSKVLENGDQPAPNCNGASIDLDKLVEIELSTGASSSVCSESAIPELTSVDPPAEDPITDIRSNDIEISAAGPEISTCVSSTGNDKPVDNDVRSVAERNVRGSNLDSADMSTVEASSSIYSGRGTDDKQSSTDVTMDDYKPATITRPLDETELLIQRILAEAKTLEADDDDVTVTEKTVGAERMRSVSGDGETSLLDRRGMDQRLGHLFSGSEDRPELSDDLSNEDTTNWADSRRNLDVKSMRSRFRDSGRQYEHGTYRDTDSYYTPYAAGRYGDDREEEVVFDDMEFIPQRRQETEEVVREKTSDIRNMVEKQSTVLKKLKEASDSFDDINKEIRLLKQDFLESQYRRSFAHEDDDDDYEEQQPNYGYQPSSYRYETSRLSSSYATPYESPYAKSAVRLDPELQSDLPVANRSLGSLATTWSYPDTSSRSTRYDTNYHPSYSSRYSSGLTGSTYSRTLFDDDNADDDIGSKYSSYLTKTPRDDDCESFNGSSYSFDSSTSAAADTGLSSYRSKYGLAPSTYTSSMGRYNGDTSSMGRYNGDTSSTGRYNGDTSSTGRYNGDTSSTGRYTGAALSRARTLPETTTEHTGFSSRFLSKVRDQKTSGDEPKSPKRDKPFKSRFLRQSYDSAYGSPASTPATTPVPSSVSHFPILSCHPTLGSTALADTGLRASDADI